MKNSTTIKTCIYFIFFTVAFIIVTTAYAQKLPSQVYSEVKVMINSPEELQMLQQHDINIEHYSRADDGIILVINQNEVSRLSQTGIPFLILVEDMSAEYQNRINPTPAEIRQSLQISERDNVSGFGFGSMGGFYTYDEVSSQLDSMLVNYPNIITQKTSLGLSHQGRDIWMVKISDNPNLDESATETAIYYDALHHAREPAGMASTLYFMFWLLENYGIDPQATHLVNNREMFFVPVVNPDGYVYNQQTNPNGGGFWRKNRRNNGGSFGVDLNRNYSFGWGNNNGSSGVPSSETYRGPSPFSEPESQAVRDLLAQIHPAIAFSTHTYGEKWLNPFGYIPEAPSYEIYSEFSSGFLADSEYLYGITWEMLGYFSSGTTRDYLHSQGVYGWTPEVGSAGQGGFWPFVSNIIPIVSENLNRFQYIAQVGGAFADFQRVKVVGKGYAEPGDTLSFEVFVKNRGLSQEAKSVFVTASTNYPFVTPLVDALEYDAIGSRKIISNKGEPFRFLIMPQANHLDQISFQISISQEDVNTSTQIVTFTVGKEITLFFDDAENGRGNWSSSGSGASWDTTFVSAYSGTHSFADSRYGNAQNNTNSYFTLNQSVNLHETQNPKLLFWAKWNIETGYDYTRLQISTNNGSTWTSLPGNYTIIFQGQPSYSGAKHWVEEEIDLSPYIGAIIKFRFVHHTDGGIPGDGFYFDDFKVVDFIQTPVSVEDQIPGLPQTLALMQNFPNPFNPTTTIQYQLPQKFANEIITLKIYNTLGQEIRALVNTIVTPGVKSIVWVGKNNFGEPVSSGVYIYRLQVSETMLSGKMLLLR